MKAILDETSAQAKKILSEHRACLDHIAKTLLEREVIQGSELDDMLKRELCAGNGDQAVEPPALSERI